MSMLRGSIVLLMAWIPLQASAEILISRGSTWSYLDDGSPQGLNSVFAFPGFDDSAWKTGPAQLGYGEGDENTVVSYGSDLNNKFTTTYFRKRFSVADPTKYTDLTLKLVRDDGALVCFNDSFNCVRFNLPNGSASSTPATNAIGGADENTFVSLSLPANSLVAGDNLVYVEMHQSTPASSDLSFDLELIGNTAATTAKVIRGPYLQSATPAQIHILWRTDSNTDSVVRYGLAADNLDKTAQDAASVLDHDVTLTGLEPGKRYWYSVGTSASPLAGNDAATFFETPPAIGSARAARVWVIGDAGTGDQNQGAVYNAYRSFAGSNYTHLWLMLGDNAYLRGTDPEYQAKVFDVYKDLFKQTPVWPTIGNHDAYSADSATESGPYYEIFNLPRNGEAGGSPSGTEAYYAFNYANIHFVVLDSEESNRAADGTMMRWLRADLQSSNADWLIAYWHRPPYTKGSHDSDSTAEPTLTEMRERFLPVLEQYGVDLVLSGHSHSYERSKFINGHYGLSSTFSDATHVIQSGPGKANPDNTGAYLKTVRAINAGAVYAVAGSSGMISGGPLNHPAMQVSLNKLGSMVLDVDGLALHARFLESDGSVTDDFTIDKRPRCALPWGGTTAEGTVVTAYQASSGSACVSEQRACAGGVLSGSYTAQTCTVSVTGPTQTLNLQNGGNGYTGNSDTQVASRKPRGKFGNAKSLAVGAGFRGKGRVASLMKWDLGAVPASSTVGSVTLSLSVNDGSTAPAELYAVQQNWDEGNAGWNQVNPTNAAGKLIGTLAAGAPGNRQITLNADGIALVQSWIAGSASNFGFMLVDTGSRDMLRFRSSEFRRQSQRPSLTVEYR